MGLGGYSKFARGPDFKLIPALQPTHLQAVTSSACRRAAAIPSRVALTVVRGGSRGRPPSVDRKVRPKPSPRRDKPGHTRGVTWVHEYEGILIVVK